MKENKSTIGDGHPESKFAPKVPYTNMKFLIYIYINTEGGGGGTCMTRRGGREGIGNLA